MKTFERHVVSQLCLMQHHFDGTDYSQVVRSPSKMKREEKGRQQQKRSKKLHR